MKKLVNKRKLKQAIYEQLTELLQKGTDMDELRHLVDHKPDGMTDADHLDKIGEAGRYMRDLQTQVQTLREQARSVGCKSLDAAASKILFVCSLHQQAAQSNIEPARYFLDEYKSEART